MVLLRDYPGKLVCIDCRYCDRTGRYGPAGLPDVLAALSADCPRRQDWQAHGPCGAGFPDLVERLRG